MVFIPRAQPLCRPVTLPMTLRGETEGILSFLPSIPVKSFIIQLPDYFKKLTRLWFFGLCVCLCVREVDRESEQEKGIAGGVMHPMALPTLHPLTPSCLIPHTPTSPNSSVTTSFCILQNFWRRWNSLLLFLILLFLFAILLSLAMLCVCLCVFILVSD